MDRTRSADDCLPRVLISPVQDSPSSIRYQMVTRIRFRKYVVIRHEDDGSLYLSVHDVSTFDPCGVPRTIRRYVGKAASF